VQDQLVDLQQRVVEELASIAANYALDATQQALIAGLALLLKPKNYEASGDLPDDEDFPDSNSIPPIRLYPAGKFTDELPDELGNIVERINSKGKITVSADVLPTRTMTVGGDVLFIQEDADDAFDCEYVCNLGTKVQKLDTDLRLTNPQSVVCRLGGNVNVLASGAISAEALTVDEVNTGKINGINTNRLVQRYTPSVDGQLNKRVANVTTQALTARRAAIKPVLSRSYDEHVARLNAELLAVKRAAYSKTLVITKSYDEDVARIHAELLSLKRSAYTKPVLTKSYDEAVVALSTDTLALKRGLYAMQTTLPARDNTRQLNAVRDALTAVKTYTAPISTSTAAALKAITNSQTGCTLAGITNLTNAAAVHKVYVYCAGYCQGDWHTSYTSTGGPQSKFSLNTVPPSAQGLSAFYHDPTLTFISTPGEGLNFRETWSATAHTSLATADLTQTTQLVGLLQSASIPANTSRWVKICSFSLYFSGEIRIFNDTPPNRGSCATIRIDFNRSSIPNATTPISITKAGNLSQFAFTGLGSYSGVYMYGITTAYTCKYSIIAYDADPDYTLGSTAQITASVPILEAPSGARIVDTSNPTTFVNATGISGDLKVTGALTVSGAEIPVIEHIHSSSVASSLNTVDAGNQQTIKTQTISGYNLTAKGTSAIVTLEGYWNLSGNLGNGNGMYFGPAIGGAFFGNSPYYPSAVGYGFNGFSCTSTRVSLTKGFSYALGVTYQAAGDGGINGQLTITHAIILLYVSFMYINGITTSGFSCNASNSRGDSRSIKWMSHGDAF
jgi:hypothetical protein